MTEWIIFYFIYAMVQAVLVLRAVGIGENDLPTFWFFVLTILAPVATAIVLAYYINVAVKKLVVKKG